MHDGMGNLFEIGAVWGSRCWTRRDDFPEEAVPCAMALLLKVCP